MSIKQDKQAKIGELLDFIKRVLTEPEEPAVPPAAIPDTAAMSLAQEEPEIIDMPVPEAAPVPQEEPAPVPYKFEVGQRLLCWKNDRCTFFPCTIKMMRRISGEEPEVLVHYTDGVDNNEWIPQESSRLKEAEPAPIEEAAAPAPAPPKTTQEEPASVPYKYKVGQRLLCWKNCWITRRSVFLPCTIQMMRRIVGGKEPEVQVLVHYTDGVDNNEWIGQNSPRLKLPEAEPVPTQAPVPVPPKTTQEEVPAQAPAPPKTTQEEAPVQPHEPQEKPAPIPYKFHVGQRMLCYHNNSEKFLPCEVVAMRCACDKTPEVRVRYLNNIFGILDEWIPQDSARLKEAEAEPVPAVPAQAPTPPKTIQEEAADLPPCKFHVGQDIFCVDTTQKTLHCTIEAIQRQKGAVPRVYVHYTGWSKCYDEWIPEDSPRIVAVIQQLPVPNTVAPPVAAPKEPEPAQDVPPPVAAPKEPEPAQDVPPPVAAPKEPQDVPAPPKVGIYYITGDKILCVDTTGKTYPAVILHTRMENDERQVYVHYNEWSDRWNEWLPQDSPRIQPWPTDEKRPESPVATTLNRLVVEEKDYKEATRFINERAADKSGEIFAFFASRWFRDIADYNAVLEQDPKAEMWEALVKNGVFRWQDLWQWQFDNINSLGLVIFFRGNSASRQHMLEVAEKDAAFKKVLCEYDVKGRNLFLSACSNCLPDVIPYAYRLMKASQAEITEAIQWLSNFRLKGQFEHDRIRDCMSYLIAL